MVVHGLINSFLHPHANMCGPPNSDAITHALRSGRHQQDFDASSRDRRSSRFTRFEMVVGTRRAHLVDFVYVDLYDTMDRLGRSRLPTTRNRQVAGECEAWEKGEEHRGKRGTGRYGRQRLASGR